MATGASERRCASRASWSTARSCAASCASMVCSQSDGGATLSPRTATMPLRPAAECGVMERAEILAAMSELKLYGMKAAFDEIIAAAVKRQHEPQRIVGDLLTAEINEKQAR